MRSAFGFVIISSTALFSACSSGGQGDASVITDAVRAGETVIARVDSTPIYASDINRAAIAAGALEAGESLKPEDPAYSGLMDELVDQRLLALRGQNSGLSQGALAQSRLQTARERILGNLVVEEHIAATVTDGAVRALYDTQIKLRKASVELRASHILVETREQIDAAAKRLKAKEDFAKIARAVSTDEGSRLDGGDLGYFAADAMVTPFSKAVFALKDGETSEPFETQFGWHIATVTARRTVPVPSFEDMRAEIISYMTFDEIKGLLEDLHENASIEIISKPAALVPVLRALDEAPQTEDLPAKEEPKDEH
ncbi:MAG: peptidylprolyl isomerase [Robiginitomaculum sp.]